MPGNLGAGWDCFRRGDFARAASIGEAALAADRNQIDALHLLGLVALRRSEPRRAEEFFSRAIAVAPEVAAFHAGLGEACASLKQVDRAIDCFNTALRLEPERPGHHYNLALLLLPRGELDATIAHLRRALQLKPDFAWAHNSLGNALFLKGENLAAIEQFRRAVELQPNSALAHSNLGSALMKAGESREALVHHQHAIRLQPNSAEAHNNLGIALHALDRLEESEASFRTAIRLQPGLASAHAGLGRVFEELGAIDDAVTSYREALRLEPGNAAVLAQLAQAKPVGLSESERAAMESMLATSSLPPEKRSSLLFGLARVAEVRGDFDHAARLTAEANALQRPEFIRRGMDYDPGEHRAFVDRLIATFARDLFEQKKGLGLETQRPVFVFGLPRSGTTLVEQILASHPQVFGAGELQLVPKLFESLPQVADRPDHPLDCLRHLDRKSIQELGSRYLSSLAELNASSERVVDKMPENFWYAGLLAIIFPRATLIHCRRNLRDVALSCWMTHFANLRWASDVEHIATRIQEYKRLANHWREVLPVHVLDVDYEALVAEPERVSRELVAWCGLEWDPACLNFHQSRRRVRTTSIAQVRQPIYRSAVDRWKNYEQPLARLFKLIEADR